MKKVLFLLLVLLTCSVTFADEPFRAVLISDSHLGFKKSDEAFAKFLEDLKTLPFTPQVLINNGDITETGANDVFERYQKMVTGLFKQSFAVIGNHDTRWNPEGKKAFAERINPIYFSKDFAGIHWMFLDSTIEHQTQGHADFRELAWIKKDLADVPPDEPILVFSHHPFKWRGISVDNGFDVIKLFSGHDVAAYFNGHGHSLVHLSFQGVPFIENDALFHDHYLILEKNGDQISLSVKTVGEAELKPWMTLSLHPQKTAEPFPVNPEIFNGIQAVEVGEIYAGLASDDHRVYAGTLSGDVIAVDPTGKTVWTKTLDGDVLAAPVVSGNRLVVGTKAGTLYAFKATDGSALWKKHQGYPFPAPPVIADDTIFIGAGDKNVYAYDLKTGQEKWHTPLGNFTEMKPAIQDGKVFIGAWDHTFYALDEKDGHIIWKTNIGKAMYYSPAVADPVLSKDLVIVAAKDHFVYALDQKTGEIRWSKPSNDSFSSPLLNPGDNLLSRGTFDILFAEVSGRVMALDGDHGTELWTKKLNTAFYNASPVEDDNFIYLVGVNGEYIKLNRKTHEIEDHLKFSPGWTFSTPVLFRGKLWVGSLDGYLYAIP